MRFAVATSVIAAVEAETEAIVWFYYQYDNVSAQSGLPGAADTKSSRLPSGVSGWDGLEQSRTALQTAWGNYSIQVSTLQTPRRAHALLAFAARC